MDDIYVYLIAGAVLAVIIIVLNKKRQKTRVADFLKDAGSAQPVLMQQAVDKKLKTLKIALYGNNNGVQIQSTVLEGINPNNIETRKQFLISKFEQLEKNYAAGGIPLKVYDDQLHQLIMKLAE
jgi:hypothetical protein